MSPLEGQMIMAMVTEVSEQLVSDDGGAGPRADGRWSYLGKREERPCVTLR